jgi:hypothetical protein
MAGSKVSETTYQIVRYHNFYTKDEGGMFLQYVDDHQTTRCHNPGDFLPLLLLHKGEDLGSNIWWCC